MAERALYCDDFQEGLDVDCCDSCHEDESLGFSTLCEIYSNEVRPRFIGFACCRVSQAIDENPAVVTK